MMVNQFVKYQLENMNRKMNFTTTKNDFDNVVNDNYTELMNSK